MTFQEAATALFGLGISNDEIGKPLGLGQAAIRRLRTLKGHVEVDEKVWRPAFYSLARQRAAELDILAIRPRDAE